MPDPARPDPTAEAAAAHAAVAIFSVSRHCSRRPRARRRA
ncbi:hypothetical protein GLE_1486 [Lysobacter enzymogenes]|uniref:Uncharacterized protein n=1 Tax=Lysobacter enzymogenes TaxID=69 RepID=A0A0S2DDY2_LYSEN|nr:hypothetical protein GLE_1486 [Lysobacter enzymogenes]